MIKKYGRVSGKNTNEKKNTNVFEFRNFLEHNGVSLGENINVLNEDAEQGGYNTCIFQATNNVNTIRKKLNGIAFIMSVPGHELCVVIMEGAKPTVIETRQAVSWVNDKYDYKKYDLIDYIKDTNTEESNTSRRGYAAVDLPIQKNVSMIDAKFNYAMQINLALRMMVLFRLNAYIKDGNDKEALEDAKKLADYICKMEQESAIALWPICIMGKGTVYSFAKRFSDKQEMSQYFILFPPYEDLKQLLYEGKYKDYIEKDLPISSYIDLYDMMKYPSNKSEVFIPIIEHLEKSNQSPLIKAYGNFKAKNYNDFMLENKIYSKSYLEYYNYIKSIAGNFNYRVLNSQNYESTFPSPEYKDSFIRYTYPIWYRFNSNTD